MDDGSDEYTESKPTSGGSLYFSILIEEKNLVFVENVCSCVRVFT